jgi:hypothetical protein
LNLSQPTFPFTMVTTRIGTLRFRKAGPDDIGRLAELRRTFRGVELWRAFLSIVGARDSEGGAASVTVEPYELSLLSDDDLERSAEKYLNEVVAEGEDAARAASAPAREDGERSAEYVVRVLEARLRPAEPVTTIDKLVRLRPRSPADLQRRLGEIDRALPDPAPPWEDAKRLAEEMRAEDDAVADARKRVEEIQDLLGQREKAWEDPPAPVAARPGTATPPSTPVAPISADESSGISAPAPPPAAAEREREMIALADAARANLRTVEQLQAVAESLTGALMEMDGRRQRSDALFRRAVVAVVAVLVASCLLSALALVQEHLHGRELRAWTDSVTASLSAQRQDMEKEIARLRDERTGLAARVQQLELERNARTAEAARPGENVKAPEPAKAAEAPRSTRAKSARSSRSTRGPAR